MLRDVVRGLTRSSLSRRLTLIDLAGPPTRDPGPARVVDEIMGWLAAAQDGSSTHDGGVASHFSLIDGWASSYPETTGYIVPTVLELARRKGDPALTARAERMLQWLVSIQFEDGSFQGGNVDAKPCVPVVFNTGQILFGLAAGTKALGETWRQPMRRAGRWLVEVQDEDGAWRKHRSPFTTPGPKSYETHVSWALMEADRVEQGLGFGDAAKRNLDWTITRQLDNGWFEDCGLGDSKDPITHTIGYAMRGLIEGWLYFREERFLASARRSADTLLGLISPQGRLAGKFDRDWKAAADWDCVTGSSQIAHCLLLLHQETGVDAYLDAGLRLNAFVRRTIAVEGEPGVRGGVKGSWPTYGAYGPYRMLNWAAKFTIDSQLLELDRAGGKP